MQALGFISPAEVQDALASELKLVSGRMPQNRTPYFVETVKAEVTRLWGTSALSFWWLEYLYDARFVYATGRRACRGQRFGGSGCASGVFRLWQCII